MTRLTGSVVAVLAALAVAPSSAAASVTPISLPTLSVFDLGKVAGPVLAGDAIVFGRPTRDGYEVVTRRGAESSVAKVTVPQAAAGRTSVGAHVEASSERVVLDVYASTCFSATCEGGAKRTLLGTFTGPLGGDLELVDGCTTRAECAAEPCHFPRSDVSGDVIAYIDCDGLFRVRDLGPGADPAGRDFPDLEGGSVRVAGPYVAASSEPGTLAVLDWRTGDRQYEVEHDPESGADFDLQEDGKLVYEPDYREVAWASPTEPTAHPVAQDRSFQELRMADDRIAARRFLPDSHWGHLFELLELDTDPSPEAETEQVSDRDALPGMDFDGSRLAWIARPCHSAFILVAGDSGGTEIERGACPFPRVVRGSAWMSRDRRLRLKLACPPQPLRGCRGKALPGGDRSRPTYYSFRAGGARTVHLDGFPKPCRTRSGRIRVKVVLVIELSGVEPREVPYAYRLRTVSARGQTEGLPRCG